MTRTTKLLMITAALITANGATAYAGDTFQASFAYDATAQTSVNLERFEATAQKICNAEMSRAGFRSTEGRFERRQCEADLLARAVKSTKSRSLIAGLAARSVDTLYTPKRSTLALLKTKRSEVVQVASNK